MSDTKDLTTQTVAPASNSKVGNQNALVHGVYASEVVLPWESAEDFEQLYRELNAEWSPQGRQQQETVLSLARLNWLKHRLLRSTQMAFRKDPFLAEIKRAGAKSWSDVSKLMDQNATAEDNLMAEIRTASQELKNALKIASDAMTATDKDSQEIYRKVEGVQDIFEKFHRPLYGKVFEKAYRRNPKVLDENEPKAYIRNPETLVEQAYHPDYLEKLVRVEASIDARIDKLLQRLMTFKEYKRLANADTTRAIPSPALAPPSGDSEIQA